MSRTFVSVRGECFDFYSYFAHVKTTITINKTEQNAIKRLIISVLFIHIIWFGC